MSDADRILLAEEMGWHYEQPYGTNSGPLFGKLPAGGGVWTKPDGSFTNRFRPDSDANDAFAVHQHMMGSERKTDYIMMLEYFVAYRSGMATHGTVILAALEPWDWTKAALEVLKQEQNDE